MTSSSFRRDLILAALRQSSEAMTVPQLARRCDCSEVSVRRCLKILLDVGLVEHVGNQPSYDARNKLRWGRGHALYTAEPARDLARWPLG